MKQCLIVTFGLVALGSLCASTASAEITFVCKAKPGGQCAFSVLKGKKTADFILDPTQTHTVKDSFAGGKYCVVVAKPPAKIVDWPPTCTNGVDPNGFHKLVENIKAGQKYD